MQGTILVAVDGSEASNRAIDLAAELSGKLGRDLCIVHVYLHGRPSKELARLAEVEHLVEDDGSVALARREAITTTFDGLAVSAAEELERARATVALGDQILARAQERALDRGAGNLATRSCAGDYAEEILDVARDIGAGMIVIGSRGLGRLEEVLLGSVSLKVLHHATCPVVVVR